MFVVGGFQVGQECFGVVYYVLEVDVYDLFEVVKGQVVCCVG